MHERDWKRRGPKTYPAHRCRKPASILGTIGPFINFLLALRLSFRCLLLCLELGGLIRPLLAHKLGRQLFDLVTNLLVDDVLLALFLVVQPPEFTNALERLASVLSAPPSGKQ